MIGPRQEHSHAQSQFEHEEPVDDPVNAVALAQRQEVEVVQVRRYVRHTCRGQKPSRVLTRRAMKNKISSANVSGGISMPALKYLTFKIHFKIFPGHTTLKTIL